MALPRALPQEITDALARGTLILTANQRAARTLIHDFNLGQRAQGLQFWEPPAILAWDTWLTSLWMQLLREGEADDLLLNGIQEHSIWRRIIAAEQAGLQSIDALAQTAAEAWRLIHHYQVRERLLSALGNSDTRAFANWVNEFERRCRRSGYLTQAQLPERLRLAAIGKKIAFPPAVLLAGFDSKTPAQTALLATLSLNGTVVEEVERSDPAPELILAEATDAYSEAAACAAWVRKRIENDPGARVAVIVPDIDSCRAELDRQFRPVLAPELQGIAATTSDGPYEFSLGVALARTPLAAAALDILRLATAPLAIERVSALLLSPYFAGANVDDREWLSRAEFDAFAMRQQHLLQPAMRVDQLLRLVGEKDRALGMPKLLKHLRLLAPLADRRDSPKILRAYTEWAAAFRELLEAAGWALPPGLDSVEFQARRKWESALDELTTLDFDDEGSPVNYSTALDELVRIAEGTLFAPESRHAPVQIMGPLESAGSIFDAVWFLGANDLAWPGSASPNPLLSWQLQREHKMPGADPAEDASHGRRITERIARSASSVVFSFATESAEGRQRQSPALAGSSFLTRCTVGEIAAPAQARIRTKLEALVDNAAIPFPPDEILRGGAGLLQAQAACGFRAFAEKRLFAGALESASLGLDAAERGSLIHNTLENFWGEVRTQANLKAMTTPEREVQLSRSIAVAFQRHHARPETGWPTAYLYSERLRLMSLLGLWLDYEANARRPFVVKAREHTLSDVQIGPLRFGVRVDRIDTVSIRGEDGKESSGEIVIDYKTGRTGPSDWHDERPNEPQLPLYAVVAGGSTLAGIAFATLRPGKDMGLRGYEDEPGLLPKAAKLRTESLSAQVEEWKSVLEHLAEDFYWGRAEVSPKKYPQTCSYCAQRLLCRLNASALSADVLEEAVEEEERG